MRGMFLMAFLTAPILVFSQGSTGTILGVVKDSSGVVVPGAKVTITDTETASTRTVTTEEDGSYRVPALPVGEYTLTFEHQGFQTQIQQGLVLTVSSDLVVNAVIAVGSVSQEVTVTGEAPLVNTTSSALGGLVNEDKMAELPLNGRNYLDLSLLQPGVSRAVNTSGTVGQQGTIISSNGAPPRSNAVLLDGAPMLNTYGFSASSVEGAQLGVDGIREYRVITNNFSAEYGSAMGSQTILVSKSGTNQFHGDVFEYLRNADMDARNTFDPTFQNTGRRVPEYERNNFGGAFGGPIVKDKTFFYATYEGLRERKGTPIALFVLGPGCHPAGANAGNDYGAGTLITPAECPQLQAPTPVGSVTAPFVAQIPLPNVGIGTTNQFLYTFIQPSTVDYGQIRLDQTLSSADTLFARFTSDAGSQAEKEGFFQPGYPQFTSFPQAKDDFATVGENHIFSGALLNSARLSFSRTELASSSISSVTDPDLYVFPFHQIGDFIFVGPGALTPFGQDPTTPQFLAQNIFNLGDDLFYTRGKHALKMGVLVGHIQSNIQNEFQTGTVVIPGAGALLLGVPALSYSIRLPGSNSSPRYDWYTLGFYGQDDWRATSRLTVNLGFRYEFNTSPNEPDGRSSAVLDPNSPELSIVVGKPFENASLRNFSPRVGFAWDVFGNAKTSVRGGFGIYYDISQLGSALIEESTGMPPFAYNATIPGPPVLPSPAQVAALNPPMTIANANIYAAQPSFDAADYYSKQPYMMQYNLSVDQQITPGMALSVGYVGTRGIHLYALSEANPCIPTGFSNGLPNWAGLTAEEQGDDCPNPTTGAANGDRVNPNYGSINMNTTDDSSRYDALQVSLNNRLGKGFQFQAAYTYSRSTDDGQGQLESDIAEFRTYAPLVKLDSGPSFFDATHNFRFNTLYHIPGLKAEGFVGKALSGWWVGTIVSAQTGYPFSVLVGGNPSDSAISEVHSPANDRADYGTSANLATALLTNPNAVVYNPATVIVGKPGEWFNPNMFTSAPTGYLGNTSRGLLRGPSFVDWDASINKDTRAGFLGEAGLIQFRAEFFNFLNHSNYALPCQEISSGSCAPGGLISSLAEGASPRDIQLALKLIFLRGPALLGQSRCRGKTMSYPYN
jgi:hypothetical protein